MRPLNIAHRGGAQLMPENTLAAFADAMERGCDGAELDVQLTRDGVVIVHHDFRLKPGLARKDGVWLTEPGPRIKDLSLEELQHYDVGTAQPSGDYARTHPLLKPTEAKIPTLDEVVQLTTGRRFLLFVELKCDTSDDSADPVALAEAVHGVTGNHAIYVGFEWRALVPLVVRGAPCWFTTDRLRGDARPVIDLIAQSGGRGWFPNFADAKERNVLHARKHGLKVGAWTVNDPRDMRHLMKLDAICTDRPDLLMNLPSP